MFHPVAYLDHFDWWGTADWRSYRGSRLTGYPCCAKHNQHAKHANARGSGDMPPRKNLKIRCSEIDSGDDFV